MNTLEFVEKEMCKIRKKKEKYHKCELFDEASKLTELSHLMGDIANRVKNDRNKYQKQGFQMAIDEFFSVGRLLEISDFKNALERMENKLDEL